MALNAGSSDQNATTSRILNKLNYAFSEIAADITTATTSDIVVFLDADDNYNVKYGDSDNVRELIGTTATAAELNYLDIATLGTGAASKAVVLDASGDYTYPASGTIVYPSGATLTLQSGSTFNVAGTFQIGGTAVDATAAEINRVADVSARIVALSGAESITLAAHDGKTLTMGTTDVNATLPAATGTGARLRFLVTGVPATTSHTIACAGTDEFNGHVYQTDVDTSDTLASYPALVADNFDLFTMNGTTTGGLVGDVIELEDVASGVWAIKAFINSSGTVATPLSSS